MVLIRQIDRPFTAKDLADMPDDGQTYEILSGEMIVSQPPSTRHQWVSGILTDRIREYGLRENLGVTFSAPLNVHLGLHFVVQPDIVFVLREHMGIIEEEGVNGSPDLLVEITSPCGRRIDKIRKAATYATSGVAEFWLVDPHAGTILAQELRDGQYQPILSDDELVHSKVIDGLVIDPKEIFAMPEWMPEVLT